MKVPKLMGKNSLSTIAMVAILAALSCSVGQIYAQETTTAGPKQIQREERPEQPRELGHAGSREELPPTTEDTVAEIQTRVDFDDIKSAYLQGLKQALHGNCEEISKLFTPYRVCLTVKNALSKNGCEINNRHAVTSIDDAYGALEYNLCLAIKTNLQQENCLSIFSPEFFPQAVPEKAKILKMKKAQKEDFLKNYFLHLQSINPVAFTGALKSYEFCRAISQSISAEGSERCQEVPHDAAPLVQGVKEWQQFHQNTGRPFCQALTDLGENQEVAKYFKDPKMRKKFMASEKIRHEESEKARKAQLREKYKDGLKFRDFMKSIIELTKYPKHERINRLREVMADYHDIIIKIVIDQEVMAILEQSGLDQIMTLPPFIKNFVNVTKLLKPYLMEVIAKTPALFTTANIITALGTGPGALVQTVAYEVVKHEAAEQSKKAFISMVESLKGWDRERWLNFYKYMPEGPLEKFMDVVEQEVDGLNISSFDEVQKVITMMQSKDGGFNLEGVSEELKVLIDAILGDPYFKRIPLERKRKAIIHFLELDPDSPFEEKAAIAFNDLLGTVAKKGAQQFGESAQHPMLKKLFAQLKNNVRPIYKDEALDLTYQHIGEHFYNKDMPDHFLTMDNSGNFASHIEFVRYKLGQASGASVPYALDLENSEIIKNELIEPKDVAAKGPVSPEILPEVINARIQLARKRIQRVIGKLWLDRQITHFSDQPLAAATVGVVYRAKKKMNEKMEEQDVIIKIMRPGLEEEVAQENEQLKEIIHELRDRRENPISPALAASLETIVGQMVHSVTSELDFRTEAKNLDLGRVYETVGPQMKIIKRDRSFPVIKSVLAMDVAHGRPMNSFIGEDQNIDLYERYQKVAQYIEFFTYLSLSRKVLDPGTGRPMGFFHGDLHEGNLFYDPVLKMITTIDLGNAHVIPLEMQEGMGHFGIGMYLNSHSMVMRGFELLSKFHELPPESKAQFSQKVKEILSSKKSYNEKYYEVLGQAIMQNIPFHEILSAYSRARSFLEIHFFNLQQQLDKVDPLQILPRVSLDTYYARAMLKLLREDFFEGSGRGLTFRKSQATFGPVFVSKMVGKLTYDKILSPALVVSQKGMRVARTVGRIGVNCTRAVGRGLEFYLRLMERVDDWLMHEVDEDQVDGFVVDGVFLPFDLNHELENAE